MADHWQEHVVLRVMGALEEIAAEKRSRTGGQGDTSLPPVHYFDVLAAAERDSDDELREARRQHARSAQP